MELDDPNRLRALEMSGLMDGAAEEVFDRATRLAARVMRVPAARLSLVGADRQFFKSEHPPRGPESGPRETDLQHALCRHVVERDAPLRVDDAERDPRGPVGLRAAGFRAYLGVPVRSREGATLGSFCVLDHAPRVWRAADLEMLGDLVAGIESEVALRQELAAARAAEDSAARDRERFQLVARSTRTIVWDWQLEDRTTWWSSGMAEFLGYDPDASQFDEVDWTTRISPDDRARVRAGLREALRGADTEWNDSYGLLRADDGVLQVVTAAVVHRDAEGRPLRVLGATRDVTEERLIEAQLRRAQRLDAVGQLTGGIAHDFNNLLTVVLGNAELLEQDPPADRRREIARLVRRSAQRGAELTDRLLAFSRQHPLRPRGTDVGRLLSELEALLSRTLGGGLRVSLEVEEGLWPALVDGSQLHNAVLNLALNARDAMPEGGLLRIRARNARCAAGELGEDEDAPPPGDYLRVEVIDSGPGMAPEVLARAVEPFFTTKGAAGSGLGLSQVYGFARQSSGAFLLRSHPGQGTAAALLLPRSTAPAEEEAPGDAASNAPRGRGELTLLVDDDPLVRGFVEDALLSLGYRVETAPNGAEALRRLSRRPRPDLIVSDEIMPGGVSGRQLLTLARRELPGAGLLLCTGAGELRGRAEKPASAPAGPEAEGRLQVLAKPFRRAELAVAARRALDLRPVGGAGGVGGADGEGRRAGGTGRGWAGGPRGTA